MATPGAHVLDEALSPERVYLTEANSKEKLLNFLVTQLGRSGEVDDPEALRSAIFLRETLMSTGIGLGIGVPHARISPVRRMVMAVAVNRTPLEDYEAIDSRPVRIVFLVAGRPDQQSNYVRLLAALSHIVKDDAHRDALLAADSPNAIYTEIRKAL